MSTNLTAMTDQRPALRALRQPIEAFAPEHPEDQRFKTSMLGLADLLEEVWRQDDDDHETLEGAILWSAAYAFPGLTRSGPPPEEWVELAAGGALMSDDVGLLRTLSRIRRILSAHRPPGLSAALFRAVLLAIYGLIRLFVLIDDPRGTDRCFDLIDTVEAMADRFSEPL
jgi:hypothetical protein